MQTEKLVVNSNKAFIVQDARDCPIPAVAKDLTALEYHHIPIELNSQAAKEPLIDIAMFGIAAGSFYARKDKLNAPYYRQFESALEKIWVREGVAARLAQANQLLVPYGVEVLVLDGYRPIALQRELWDYFIVQAKAILPSPTEEECAQFAEQYCSDPRFYKEDDFRTWPPHNTGGAVDVTLRLLNSFENLYFGSIFDDPSELSHTDYFEHSNFGCHSASATEACRNRRLLYWAMIKVGFANYPYEWWHYDFLTQMWVINSGSPKNIACYGRINLS